LTFAILTLGFSVLTTTINYILLYLSYRKIKEMAEKIVSVKVLRNSQFITVESNMLVPGDLIDPEGEMMCDCILVKGEIYVNEASLTGESMPIGKFPASRVEQTK
jgi:P-type E1-E2 ATPase